MQASKPLSIYCFDHQNEFSSKVDWVVPLYSGQKKTLNAANARLDSTGENISHLNKFFCELTGHFWVYKNDKHSKIVGFCHYRRFFNFVPTPQWAHPVLSAKKTPELMEFLSNENQRNAIDELLGFADVILPRAIYLPLSIKAQYCASHDGRKFDLFCKTLATLFPKYRESLALFERSNKFYFYNMFIARREFAEEYFFELFKILFAVTDKCGLIEERASENTRFAEHRYPGYLAERFLALYVFANRCKISESQIVTLS